jgi:hypothetical protein
MRYLRIAKSTDPMHAHHPEHAVESLKDDVLHRDQFAQRLVRTLISEKTRKATGNVVGLAGSWGSGKSSLLNFVEEQILNEYPQAIVVRFNPWLVSGRNDLVKEFLGELLAMIAHSKGKIAQTEQLMKVLIDYGTRLSPVLDFVPGGAAARGIVTAAASIMERSDSLAGLRKRLIQELATFPEPIVALVDEVDRVEDAEIHDLAQLVRSIADFPNVSYLLAYDATRVSEALGNGSAERGRSYLEKIIQLQIPVPALAPQEMTAVLRAELEHITGFSLPKGFLEHERYLQMEQLLVLRVLPTLRDVKRLIGTFRAVYALVRGEADWIDVLGYCALLTKAPMTAESLKKYIGTLVDDPYPQELNRPVRGWVMPDAVFAELIAGPEDSPGVRALLATLFPPLRGERRNAGSYVEPLSSPYTLNAVLRLGAVSDSSWSRADVVTFSKKPPQEIAKELRALETSGRLPRFVDRVRDLYPDLPGFELHHFWRGVSLALEPNEPSWDKRYLGKVQQIDSYADILMRWYGVPAMREAARLAFDELTDCGDISLVSQLLRQHAVTYGLDGQEPRGDGSWFLTREQTEAAMKTRAPSWRAMHLEGTLLPRIWELSSLYVMHAAGSWDEECTKLTAETVRTSVQAFDAMLLLLFGPESGGGQDGARRFLDEEALKALVGERMDSVRADAGAHGFDQDKAVTEALSNVRSSVGYYPDGPKLSSWTNVTRKKPAG